MKKIFIGMLLLILSCALIGCKQTISAEVISKNTIEMWDKAEEKTAEEQIILKDVSVGGVLKIKNAIIDINRNVKGNRLVFNLATRNLAIEIEDKAKGIIDLVLGYLDLQGNLKVAHLEEAFSKIGLKMNLTFEKTAVNGDIEVLNVKNMFKGNMSTSHKVQVNQALESSQEWYSLVNELLKEHIVKDFAPKGINEIQTSKEYSIAFNQDTIFNVYEKIMKIYGDSKIANSDYTINRVMYDAFAGKTGSEILKDRVVFDNLTAKYELSTFNKEKYISKMDIKSKLKLSISKKQLESIFKDISIAKNNEKVLQIYKAIESLMSYEKDFITGDIQIICNNKILK